MDEDDLKRFKEYVERTRHERSGSKEIAFQYLYEHGYIDANGDLTPRYGGPTKRHEAIKRLIAHRTAEITRTPDTARAALIEEGIYDKDGNLTAEYGGEVATLSRLLNSISRMASFVGLKFTPDEAKIRAFLTARRMRKSNQMTTRTPTHPGAILREDVLPALFAEQTGIDVDTLQEILAERADVTPEISEKLGKRLGNGRDLWLSLQKWHDEWKNAYAKAGNNVVERRDARR